MKKLVALLLSLVMLLSLCTVAFADGTKDTITFAYEAEPSGLSTTENNEVSSYYPCFLLYSGLFKYGQTGPEKDLCTEYHTELDANGEETIWVFTIREGVKFTDGTDLTAEDVADTLNFAHERPAVSGLTGFYTKAEAVDAKTVKLYTNGVYATTPASLAHKCCAVLPSELIAAGHDFNNEPVGCGPYKLVKWNKGENILFEANENYYGGAPAIKNINWRFIAEGSSRTLSLQAGEVDFVVSVDSLDIARLQADDKYNVSITNGSMFTYFLLNGGKAPFNDVNFRKFLACAINREDVIEVALNGFGTPLVGCINVNIAGTTAENAEDYDEEKAAAYIAAWGGDPESVNFEILVSNDVRRRIAEVIQGELLEYGVNCTITTTESATCSSLAKSGEYDAMIFAYTTNDFATYAKNLYYVSDEAHAGNKFRMSYDDSLNALIDEINITTDENERAVKITDFVKQLNAKQPVVPIYCSQVLLAYDKNLQGVSVDSQGYFRVEKFSWAN